MSIPIVINGRELRVNDINVEPNAEYLVTVGSTANSVKVERIDLKTDNAKLRELACHLYECMCNVDAYGSHECDVCKYDNAEGKCDFERLMQELGVEVTA